MKRLLIICATVLFAHTGFAQNTGFLGKRFIIKTNLVSGLQLGFMNADVEASVHRRVSVTASFRYFTYNNSFIQKVRLSQNEFQHYYNGDRYNGVYTITKDLKIGASKAWVATAGARYYFNKIIPAPLGLYTEIGLGFGMYEFSNFAVVESLRYKYGPYSYPALTSYTTTNDFSGGSYFIYFEVPALGYQFALLKFLTLDFKMSVEGYYCDFPSSIPNEVKKNYFVGPNLIGFGSGNLGMGLGLYGKLGFSLF